MTSTQHHPAGVTTVAPTTTSPAPADVRPARIRPTVRARRLLATTTVAALVAVAAVWITASTDSEPASRTTVSATQPDLDDPVTRQEFVDRFEPGSFGLHDATG